MKFLILSLVGLIGLTVSAPVLAGNNGAGSDSCGLGWYVTKKKTWLGTSTRFTTNFVLPPPFSMTTGTSGCDYHSIAKKDHGKFLYIAENYEPLKLDIAQGRGEYLNALAEHMGCSTNSIHTLEQTLQKSYRSVVPPTEHAPRALMENIQNTIRNNRVLQENCKNA